MALPPWLAALLLGEGARDLSRTIGRLRQGRTLRIVLDADDPYSQLVAQIVPGLLQCGLEPEVLLIPPPGPEWAPDAERLRAWAWTDAARLADAHGLRRPTPPEPGAAEALAGLPAEELLARFAAGALSGPPAEGAAGLLARDQQRLHAAGHYQGGMLQLEGEWYWGLDRLDLLEEHLRARGLAPAERSAPVWTAAPVEGPLELFYSFRSPYSYLALDRVLELVDRTGVELRVRTVLPMVMRGLSVPRAKRLYLGRDCARLARQLGVPFGRFADPVGAGVERCLGIVPLAEAEGRLPAFLVSAGRGIWAEGIDVATDRGLALVTERAGLDPAAALGATADEGWRQTVEDHRLALLEMGLWGVPCFRAGEFVLWGQDRLPLLEAALTGGAQAAN
ncbi:MAG: DsbA family protein [Alphaproteobacteria bacterium]|nr:DsbA family protein [Alphaproteobacteria bacterium]